MSLFTVIADYDGGIYISQHRARTARNATLCWASQETYLVSHMGLNKKQFDDLYSRLNGDSPTKVAAAVSVWCVSAIVKKKILLLNIVKTKEV